MFSQYVPNLRVKEYFGKNDYMSLNRDRLPIALMNTYPHSERYVSWDNLTSFDNRAATYKFNSPRLMDVFLRGNHRYYSRNLLQLQSDEFDLRVIIGLIWDKTAQKLLAVAEADREDNRDITLWIDNIVYKDPRYKKLINSFKKIHEAAAQSDTPMRIESNITSRFLDLAEIPIFDDFEEEVQYYDTLLLKMKPEIRRYGI
jgi:hypothetical protein